jgi:hypothetical protein
VQTGSAVPRYLFIAIGMRMQRWRHDPVHHRWSRGWSAAAE